MVKKNLLFLLLLAAFIGCKKEITLKNPPVVTPPVVEEDNVSFVSVKLEADKNPGIIATDIDCTIKGDEIAATIPQAAKLTKKLVVTFSTQNSTVYKNDTLQVSGKTAVDLRKPVTYTLTSAKGTKRNYKFLVSTFTGIPILYLTTAAPVVSKDNYVTGSVTVDANNRFEQEKTTIPLKIKGRGNSTWSNFPKKPYRLKFDNKAAMLGMPAAKNWVLLANYDDKTLLRNRIALEFARRIGSDFASESRFVEVVMNGVTLGNYLLTSQVEVNENRVNITEMSTSDNAGDALTGGYLLELDQRLDEAHWFRTKKNLPFTIKSPENATPAQIAYISKYMQDTEDALFSPDANDPVNGYAKYINVESFMNWFFVEEVLKNQDARDFSSIFYYKDRNGKLGMGPVWDFDLSSGNIDYSVAKDPNNWYNRDATWMINLFKDVKFRSKIKVRWNQIRNTAVEAIFKDIDDNAEYLKLSQKQNFTTWPILDKYVWPNAVVLGNYDMEVAYAKSFLKTRIAWIDAEIAKY
ncbi:CotH kinase family protein [Mucilaginibacter lutimaris]|uniref:CotH kinase family protein n=1 Tax=Mucilaginibacter lutimaris TaxID=931629 RepID=A0ABW2ZHJ7_9SPHI